MLKDITAVDIKILGLFTKDYAASFSIREITARLKINYSNAFKRISLLVNKSILSRHKTGQANSISLNIKNMETLQLISFAEERESKSINNATIHLLAKKAAEIDAMACVGIFGSRVSGKAVKSSDWDVFIITQSGKIKEMGKIMSNFPHIGNIQAQIFSPEEFQESLLSAEETVVRHIARNKQIVYNPHVFYSLVQAWEKVKYAPSQTS